MYGRVIDGAMPLPLVTWCERDAINQERSPDLCWNSAFTITLKSEIDFVQAALCIRGHWHWHLMAGHWHAAPGLWSHPCHGSSDLGKVRSVDTWHSPGVLGLVSGLSSLSLIGWSRSSLINNLLSITNTHSCHPQLSLNIDTRFTFPGSWNSSVLLQVMFVAIEWVEPRNLNSLPGPLSMPTLSSQSNLMLLSILMILPMPICGPVIRIKTCSEMYWNYSRYVKNRGLEV